MRILFRSCVEVFFVYIYLCFSDWVRIWSKMDLKMKLKFGCFKRMVNNIENKDFENNSLLGWVV